VRALAHLGPDQPEQQLDPEQEKRRQHHEQHREADDVEAGRATGGEELRVVLQEIEERLGYGERPEDREVQEGPGGFASEAAPTRSGGLGGAHPRFGRA
jgi:hypothetical protein